MTRSAVFAKRTRRLLTVWWYEYRDVAVVLSVTAAVFLSILILAEITGRPERPVKIISPIPEGCCQKQRKETNYDRRSDIIKVYLQSRGSVLANFSFEFVEFGDRYGVDPSALVAVSGIESGFGRDHLCGSYNPFGYGRPCWDFRDYPSAILQVAKTIGTSRYYRKYQESRDPRDLAGIYNEGNEEAWIRAFDQFSGELARIGELTYVR